MRLGVLSQAGGTIDTFRESPLAALRSLRRCWLRPWKHSTVQ